MALGIYAGVAFALAGNSVIVAPAASIEIRREDTNALAAIFSDRAGAAPLANPFTADTAGRFAFYADPLPAGYKVSMTMTTALAAGAPEVFAVDPLAVTTVALRNQQVALDATAFGMTLLDDPEAITARGTLGATSHDDAIAYAIALG